MERARAGWKHGETVRSGSVVALDSASKSRLNELKASERAALLSIPAQPGLLDTRARFSQPGRLDSLGSCSGGWKVKNIAAVSFSSLSFVWQRFLVLVAAVTAALSLRGPGFDKDTCVLTPSPPQPISSHTQLLFSVSFIRFDTPHPPAIVRKRKGRIGLFVGISWVCVCECGSKLRATSASILIKAGDAARLVHVTPMLTHQLQIKNNLLQVESLCEMWRDASVSNKEATVPSFCPSDGSVIELDRLAVPPSVSHNGVASKPINSRFNWSSNSVHPIKTLSTIPPSSYTWATANRHSGCDIWAEHSRLHMFKHDVTL